MSKWKKVGLQKAKPTPAAKVAPEPAVLPAPVEQPAPPAPPPETEQLVAPKQVGPRLKTGVSEVIGGQLLALLDELCTTTDSAKVLNAYLEEQGPRGSKQRDIATRQLKFQVGRLKGALEQLYGKIY